MPHLARAALVACLLLTGCGQKGPLHLPEDGQRSALPGAGVAA